jgi:vacuolar protein sorting-associated protein 13A/C
LNEFVGLERKLSYEDLRLYRSLTRSRLKNDEVFRQRVAAEKARQQAAKENTGWGSWLWGSSNKASVSESPTFGGTMTDQQRKELYAVLEYDESDTSLTEVKSDALKLSFGATLSKGSLALKARQRETATDILRVQFDVFRARAEQRQENLEAIITLQGFSVFDGTTPGSLYPQIVQVKDHDPPNEANESEPFLFVKYEHKPLDERADDALTLRMRHSEIIYHRGYVEVISRFFKPPSSKIESVEALIVSPATSMT